jgi:hypothetical protein
MATGICELQAKNAHCNLPILHSAILFKVQQRQDERECKLDQASHTIVWVRHRKEKFIRKVWKLAGHFSFLFCSQ